MVWKIAHIVVSELILITILISLASINRPIRNLFFNFKKHN